MTRLMEEIERTRHAPTLGYNSPETQNKPVLLHAWAFPDGGVRQPINDLQDSTGVVGDNDEKKLYQLSATPTEHAARIDPLEDKVSRFLSNAPASSLETSILARQEKEQEFADSSDEDSEMSSVGMLTPTSTVRSSSPVSDPRSHQPTMNLSVKGYSTNMSVKIGLNTPLRNLRWNFGRSRSASIELWYGNTQIMDGDTPNTLGLDENSLINIVEHAHRSDWMDESLMHYRNIFEV
ncbi:hypothetical protein QM012_003337 [Aureobasidium pullulans]|uniref:Ubiquitin-like domain-containing protein n=1 Tax=Aureobasidium pullulans TaxID=5580 RepID=A0ABR0T8H5_AURPU